MKIIDTKITELKIVETAPIEDMRGSFTRWFCAKELESLTQGKPIVHINHSKTLKTGCIRGLHYQKQPYSEIKLARCIRGRLWDVALDLRKNSPTFLQWHSEELTEENNRMLIIPEGFAHGFQALEPNSELLYFNTTYYTPEADAGVHYADPRINVSWPLPPVDISERDRSHPFLEKSFEGLK